MRPLFLISSLVGLAWQPGITHAQQRADLVSWNWTSVRLQPDSSRWALEVAPSYVAYQNLTRTFLRLGLARVNYTWPRPQLTLALVYEAGCADQRGMLHLTQLQASQALANRALHPHWQLTLDRLWFTPTLYEGQERQPIYRFRTLVGIAPQLSPRLSLVVNTEPFVYRTATWLQEVRSQAGLQLHPWPGIRAQVLYWNWWAGYAPRRVRWQHTVLLTATLSLHEMRGSRGSH